MAIKDASKEALVELRALVGVLRDETEAAPRCPASMLDSLDDLVERSAPRRPRRCTRVVEGDVRRLPAAVELAAFRIVQEAITNVVRHSGAQHADVASTTVPTCCRSGSTTPGSAGTRAAIDGAAAGMRGMRERARAPSAAR